MISSNVGRRARLFLMFGAAGRSAPMMGINRTSFSRRLILFLLVLLGMPLAARSAALEDSAKELARKIAAALPAQEGVFLELRNISSSSADEFAGAERALRDELEQSKVHVVASAPASVHLGITLSENIKGLLWSAEIARGDSSQVIFIPVNRDSDFLLASKSMPVVLQSKIIWAGAAQILDAMVASWAGGPARLLLLHPDGLEVQTNSINMMFTVMFPSTGIAARDPQGILELNGAVASVKFPERDCTVNLEALQLMECHALTALNHGAGDMGTTSGGPLNPSIPRRVSEILMPEDGCGASLTTGSGDDTQPDWVQAFATKTPGIAISNKVNFPGPVLALHGGASLRAIVRNVKTGNYEAYILSCGE